MLNEHNDKLALIMKKYLCQRGLVSSSSVNTDEYSSLWKHHSQLKSEPKVILVAMLWWADLSVKIQ